MTEAELELTPAEARDRLQDENRPLLLDVRNGWERELCTISGSVHVPLNELPSRAGELERGRTIIVYCHHGIRSLMAARYLQEQGFDAVSLSGGIDLWSSEIDPSVPRY